MVKKLKIFDNFYIPNKFKKSIILIGNFDGLHSGHQKLFDLAKIYYVIVMIGVPILGLCMMSNNTIRSEGKPKIAMYAMFIPSISNLCLDYLFIYELGLGMYGAALATTLSYFICGIYIVVFFLKKI